MMKKLLLSVLLFSITYFIQAQDPEEGKGIRGRFDLEVNMTKDPNLGFIPKERLVRAYNLRKHLLESTAYRASLFTWTERGPNSDVAGPSNGNTRAGNAITSGRLRAIWEDLSDATGKTVWVGGVDGGLWKTTNITSTPAVWSVINDYFGNLSVSSICQDPSNFNIMYFGTGEKTDNADAVRGGGVWMSSDHGITWSVMNGTQGFWKITKIICDASGNLYVACSSSSTNAGLLRFNKSTQTWDNITPTGLSPRIADIELSSTGRLHLACGYRSAASVSGYRYTDNPSTVTAAGWISPVTSYSPVEFNVDLASVGNTLYALPVNSSYQVATIYKSTNGGVDWSATGSTPVFTSGQGWYCIALAIDPANVNNVIVGSLDCYKTTNGGGSWTKISNWVGTSGQYVHADQHIMSWRSNNQVLIGSDGGIHYSPNGGTNFYDKNTGLRIKQFYSVAVHPTLPNYFLAGAQDNGTHQLNSPGMASSVEVTGGDGAYVHIDQDQPEFQWGSYVYNQYRRSINGGSTWSSINFSGTAGRFINPTDYDDVNNIMYCSNTVNSYLKWSDPQTGSTFTPVTMGLNNGSVSAVKVSPYTNNTVFFGGGGGGVLPSLIKATNANTTPTFINIIGASMQISSANINSIEFGTNENNIIVAFSNYGINNVWVTNDGGTNWAAIDGNLPDMPVRWAMFYPGTNSKAIIATETGVWQTELINGSSTAWDPETSFPNVRTDMLQYRSSDGLLVASTHGRGIFSAIISASSCGNVASLTSSAITISSATISWSALNGAANYDVDYKLASSATWINVATATTSTSINQSGLLETTQYECRVRANCTNGATGNYSTINFTTATTPTCGAITGLNSSDITSVSATVSWSALTGAATYDVEYKEASTATWLNAVTATLSTSANLSGLSQTILYDWRVRANCSNGLTGNYTQQQFTTPIPTCGLVSGLTTSAITAVSATLNWSAMIGSGNYDVEYKEANSIIWINLANATTSTSFNLTGLLANTLYDWKVRANCTNDLTGDYTTTTFTTLPPPSCGNVTGLVSSPILATSATLNWTALSGAGNYDVEYKIASSESWTNAGTGISSTSLNLTGLTVLTLYDWRVRANCTNGLTGNYTQAQFTTTADICPDIFEPNNTLTTPAPISVGVNYNAQISSATDKDYYSFTNTLFQLRIKVTLTNLPANYDLILYNSRGSSVGSSVKLGTLDEKIIYNATKTTQVGTYRAYVYGKSGAFSTTKCYTLLIQLSATNFLSGNILEDEMPQIVKQGGIKLFPVPASKSVTVSFDAESRGTAEVQIINQFGAIVYSKSVSVDNGINFNTINTSNLPSGIYTVKVVKNKEVEVAKLLIQQ